MVRRVLNCMVDLGLGVGGLAWGWQKTKSDEMEAGCD